MGLNPMRTQTGHVPCPVPSVRPLFVSVGHRSGFSRPLNTHSQDFITHDPLLLLQWRRGHSELGSNLSWSLPYDPNRKLQDVRATAVKHHGIHHTLEDVHINLFTSIVRHVGTKCC